MICVNNSVGVLCSSETLKTGKQNPGAKYLIEGPKPELVNLIPTGIPVLIAVAFLCLLAFLFMK